MTEKIIEVFIVDDSKVARDVLSYIIGTDPQLKIIGYAKDGQEALQWLKYQTPDVITMDIEMPILDGFQTTRHLMQVKPIPIVIVSSKYIPFDAEKSFEALEAGALAILESPHHIKDEARAAELLHTIHMLAGIDLIKRRKDLTHREASPPQSKFKTNPTYETQPLKAIVIGASLGGPLAIQQILKCLPATLPVPLFLSQHITLGFSEGFANWLQKSTALTIKLASHGEYPAPGTIYIAPDGCHMTVNRLGGKIEISLEKGLKADKPCIDKLFRSIAEVYGPQALGIILTGMGSDGAKELLFMRQKGGYTIAQDEASCVLFGMPREAIRMGGAMNVLSPPQIAEEICRLTKITNLDFMNK